MDKKCLGAEETHLLLVINSGKRLQTEAERAGDT
jgi:hypothetical protein